MGFAAELPITGKRLPMDVIKTILAKIDVPRRISDVSVKPMVIEWLGMPKAGKDTQLVRAERLFRRAGAQMMIYQESAEALAIRRLSKKTEIGQYGFQMRHLAYSLGNFIDAVSSRDFHVIMQNRGLVDTLCWLELARINDFYPVEQIEVARDFILRGPWLTNLDAIISMTCSVDTALMREYGTLDLSGVKLGSNMNPANLEKFLEMTEKVCSDLVRTYPNVGLIKIDTTGRTPDETEAEIREKLCRQLLLNYSVSEEELLVRSLELLRSQGTIERVDVKLCGKVSTERLRKCGWFYQARSLQEDIYLRPKNKEEVNPGERFHIRRTIESGIENGHLFYKRDSDKNHMRLVVPPIPLTDEGMDALLVEFDILQNIKKKRTYYFKENLNLAIDEVDGLGDFIEIKGPANTDYDSVIKEVELLGFSNEHIVPENYLQLKLKKGLRP